MGRWGESTKTRGGSAAASATVFCALLIHLGAGATLAGSDGDPLSSNVRLRSGLGRALVLEAARGAARRLARPGCQKLLTDFSDAAGRPLAAALERNGLAAPDYLGRILFYSATRSQCAAKRSVAITLQGSRAVFVCEDKFRELALRNAAFVEAAIIHEALHSLGLGENPPSSEEITARVLERCAE
jgi:hypothetical protein